MRRRSGRAALVVLVIGAALIAVPWPEKWVEPLYLGVLLPFWSRLTAPLVDAVSVSLTGLLLISLSAGPLLVLIASGRRALRSVLQFWVASALLLLLLFPLTFGLGYRLPSLAAKELPPGTELTESMRQELSDHVLTLLQSSGLWSSRSATSHQAIGADSAAATAAGSACVARLAAELRPGYPPATLPSRIKLLPAGLMLRFGFAGVASPWLLEPHVDAGLPAASRLAVSLHEFAHSAGFASEAEAEAVGMIAGLECSDQRVVYAAALRLASNLAAAATPEARRDFVDAWPERARRDARALARASERFTDSALAPGATAAYDLYLRSQGEAAGIGEYDRGTELALQMLYQRQLTGNEAGTGLPN